MMMIIIIMIIVRIRMRFNIIYIYIFFIYMYIIIHKHPIFTHPFKASKEGLVFPWRPDLPSGGDSDRTGRFLAPVATQLQPPALRISAGLRWTETRVALGTSWEAHENQPAESGANFFSCWCLILFDVDDLFWGFWLRFDDFECLEGDFMRSLVVLLI